MQFENTCQAQVTVVVYLQMIFNAKCNSCLSSVKKLILARQLYMQSWCALNTWMIQAVSGAIYHVQNCCPNCRWWWHVFKCLQLGKKNTKNFKHCFEIWRRRREKNMVKQAGWIHPTRDLRHVSITLESKLNHTCSIIYICIFLYLERKRLLKLYGVGPVQTSNLVHLPNLMQMSSNKELGSLTLRSAKEKFDVWTRPHLKITYWTGC